MRDSVARHLLLYCSSNIILDICPNDILRALHHTSTFMQQRTLRLPMRKYSNTTHNRLDRVRIDDTLFDARNEEGRFAAHEVVVEVDEERKEGGLAGISRGGIVLISVCSGMNAGGWPCTV